VSICVQVVKTIVNTGFLKGWTAIVSGNVSSGAIAKTIRHHWLELAETSPPFAFKNAVGYGLFSRSDEHVMKTRFNLFRRAGVFYTEDTATGKQTSLRTRDETEAKSLLACGRNTRPTGQAFGHDAAGGGRNINANPTRGFLRGRRTEAAMI
jgi:hypothetical protein